MMTDTDQDQSKIRIIIVDDHAVLRAGLRMLLASQSDMDVVAEAESAKLALTQAEELIPDIVLMDITLADGSGVEAIRPLLEASPNSRIVMLTMHDDPAYARAALAAGAAGFVVKKALDTELLEAIRVVHRGRSYVNVSVDESGLHPAIGNIAAGKEPTQILSQREQEVLQLVAYGYTNRSVAERLGVSIKSVETYRARIMNKLGLSSRVDLIRYALECGIISAGNTP